MIALTKLSMTYGPKLLFYDTDLLLNDNTHYALVGANGTGKSTLLRLLNGEEEPTAGEISIPKSATVGWLKQDQFRYENTIIVDVVIQGKPKLWEALQEKEVLLAKGEWDDKTGFRLGELEEIIAHNEGYTANAFAEKLLKGLGIAPEFHYQPLSALSGGFKLRVLLAQALFEQPDILLLDEPTNHLDIASIDWLEQYLNEEYQGLLLFISHDIEFINRLANYIIDVDYGEIRQYSGKYAKFLEEKKLIEEQKLQIKKQAEDKIADMQAFVDKFKAKASKAKQAQSRMKMIDKIEMPDIKKSSRIAPYFNFKPHRPSGKNVLEVKKLGKAYGDAQIFKNISFNIHRGEKIAVVGANGMGKSTLVKTILGKIPHEEGTYEWGHETAISYFSQDQHDLLNESMPVLEWLSGISNAPEQRIRQVLGQVLFNKESVAKDILALSGGEAARLLLARIMLEENNVIVLDEPTNHLDIEATDALAAALANYAGTVIVISHNRYFLNKIANRVLYISRDKPLKDFKGHYSEYEAQIN